MPDNSTQMNTVSDSPDLLLRLGEIQRGLVTEAHRMARAAGALGALPHGCDPGEALATILRAACEHLDFDRAYAYLLEGDAIILRYAWPQGRRSAGALERLVIQGNRPAASRSGKTVVVPLILADHVAGALRLERGAAKSAGGDASAPIMRFAEAASIALDNAILAERVRSQRTRIESLSGRLAEANHRIKNNLQALAGLLAEHQDARGLSRRGWSHALREGVGRIQAIAVLHEVLSCAGDEAADLAALARRICAETAAVGQVGERIAVVVSATPVRAGPDLCRAFALILHELVSNALLHAYPGRRRGEVRVALRRTGQGAALEVADDGVGLGGVSADRMGMGLSIVAAIAENELRGKLEFDAERGTTVRLEFPLVEMA